MESVYSFMPFVRDASCARVECDEISRGVFGNEFAVRAGMLCIFFFSSRRRHTRSKRDWSSDVCSSDLNEVPLSAAPAGTYRSLNGVWVRNLPLATEFMAQPPARHRLSCGARACSRRARWRSEERRVGKECRSRWSPDHLKKKKIMVRLL